MAKRIYIQTDRDCYVHFDTENNDYTLCGLETAGDDAIGLGSKQRTLNTVDCPQCVQIVQFCKSIKSTEYD